jgi:hypothetical protein
MAQVTTECIYSQPVRYDNTVPTLPTHAFYFKKSVCNVSNNSTTTPTTTTNITLNSYNPTTTISSSSDIAIYGAISAGEIVISLFLFLIICFLLITKMISGLNMIKTKKQFLGYNGGDVEVRDDF